MDVIGEPASESLTAANECLAKIVDALDRAIDQARDGDYEDMAELLAAAKAAAGRAQASLEQLHRLVRDPNG